MAANVSDGKGVRSGQNFGEGQLLPREQWILLPGVHAGYISWEEYEQNQQRLRENAQALGDDRRKSPPREGPALLQGLVLCGICGTRMTVRYHNRAKQRVVPYYMCQKDGIKHGQPLCQGVNGEQVDQTIRDLLIQTMTPMALDVALSVQQEIQARVEEVDRAWSKISNALKRSGVRSRNFLRTAAL